MYVGKDLTLIKDDVVVDLGRGTGWFSELFSLGVKRVILIDIDFD